jgi:heme exporter protein A
MIIRIRGLEKAFGHHRVLRGVDLDVAQGDCLALIGPNGAGKTTLLRILATLSKANAGHIQLDSTDLRADPQAVRRRIGFLSHQPLLYGDLSAEENLRFYGQMYDVTNLKGQISALLDRVGLEDYRHELVRTFSRGMRQRLSIARALLHNPPILMMDEPYTGLDQQASSMLDEILSSVGVDAHTVILTTHDLEHGWQISNRTVMLVNGKTVPEMDKAAQGLDAFRQAYEAQTRAKGG